jgi:hypothetical protein
MVSRRTSSKGSNSTPSCSLTFLVEKAYTGTRGASFSSLFVNLHRHQNHQSGLWGTPIFAKDNIPVSTQTNDNKTSTSRTTTMERCNELGEFVAGTETWPQQCTGERICAGEQQGQKSGARALEGCNGLRLLDSHIPAHTCAFATSFTPTQGRTPFGMTFTFPAVND